MCSWLLVECAVECVHILNVCTFCCIGICTFNSTVNCCKCVVDCSQMCSWLLVECAVECVRILLHWNMHIHLNCQLLKVECLIDHLSDGDSVYSREKMFEIWGLPWKIVWYLRGIPWKLVGNCGSRNDHIQLNSQLHIVHQNQPTTAHSTHNVCYRAFWHSGLDF